jgi:hypothetical protein
MSVVDHSIWKRRMWKSSRSKFCEVLSMQLENRLAA